MELTAMTFAFPKKKYHNGGHLIYSCQYHVIFCPKYRRPVLDPPYDSLYFFGRRKRHEPRTTSSDEACKSL